MQLVLIREIISKVRSKGNLTIEDYKDEWQKDISLEKKVKEPNQANTL
jgi:hypothetical protein